MEINLTREQYLNLLELSYIANNVFGVLGDIIPEARYKRKSEEMDKLEDYLLKYAGEFGCSDLVEDFHGKTLLKDEIYERMQETMDEYDDFTFWNNLEVRMGKRDFGRTITKEEEREMEKNGGWYPDRINELYDKYAKELEEYGIERLEILEKA